MELFPPSEDKLTFFEFLTLAELDSERLKKSNLNIYKKIIKKIYTKKKFTNLGLYD